AIELVETMAPAVAILDVVGITHGDARRWVALVQQTKAVRHMPTMVLCAGGSTMVHRVIELGVADVVEEPFNWELIAHRAARLASTHASLRALRRSQSRLRDKARTARATFLRYHRSRQTDDLTGLATRPQFEAAIGRLLAEGETTKHSTAVLVARLGQL